MNMRLSTNDTTNKPYKLLRAKNEFIYFEGSHKAVDLCSQTVNLLFGNANQRIIDAVKKQMYEFTFSDEDFLTDLVLSSLNELYSILPRSLNVMNFRINDASSSVECAIKLARLCSKKKKILTCEGIYLGQNLQNLHIRGYGKKRDEILIGSYEDVVFCKPPFDVKQPDNKQICDFAIEYFEKLVLKNKDELACVILDPVMLSAGGFASNNMKQFIRKSNEITKKNDIIYILDESQSFGWVPNATLTKYWSVDTDIIILGKGIASGFPLSICVSKDHLDGLQRGDADYTHGGHPISLAAMRETVNLIKETEENFVKLIEKEKIFMNEQQKNMKDINLYGEGLIWGVRINKYNDYEDNVKLAKKAARILLDNGIYVRSYMNGLGIKPPRNIQPNVLFESLTKLFCILKTIEL